MLKSFSMPRIQRARKTKNLKSILWLSHQKSEIGYYGDISGFVRTNIHSHSFPTERNLEE